MLKYQNRKVAIIGDLHGNPSAITLQELLDYQPDLLIVGGDIFDMEEFSTHDRRELKSKPSFQDELSRTIKFFDRLLFPTKFIHGNHDIRFFKQIVGLFSQDLTGLVNDPIDLLINQCRCSRQMTNDSQKFHNGTDSAFVLTVGDVFISHNNFVGKLALAKLGTWVDEVDKELGLGNPRILVQFHTHACKMEVTRGTHRILIEPGHSAEPIVEKYKFQYDTKYRIGIRGWLSLEQSADEFDNFVTDLSSVRLHF